MAIPLILHAAVASQGLPVVAVLARRDRLSLPTPTRWVLIWCTWQLLSDLLSLFVARLSGENLWTLYVTVPIGSTLALWALADWQPSEFLALSYRLMVPGLLLITVATLAAFRPLPTFDLFLAPMHALALLVASLHTLVRRAIREEGPLADQPWFWVCLGMSLYYGMDVAIRPFTAAALAHYPSWVRSAYIGRAFTEILAFVLIAVGVTCPSPRRSSGRS